MSKPVVEIDTRVEDDKLAIRVTGELDCYTAPSLVDTVTAYLENGAPLTEVGLDLSAVDFCGVAGISALEEVAEQSRSFGAHVSVRTSSAVDRVAAVTGSTWRDA